MKKGIECSIDVRGAVSGVSIRVTTANCLLSIFYKLKAQSKFALTGAVDINGNVKAIGGVTEKALATFRHDLEMILPEENRSDLMGIDDEVNANFKFHFINHISELDYLCFNRPKQENKKFEEAEGSSMIISDYVAWRLHIKLKILYFFLHYITKSSQIAS